MEKNSLENILESGSGQKAAEHLKEAEVQLERARKRMDIERKIQFNEERIRYWERQLGTSDGPNRTAFLKESIQIAGGENEALKTKLEKIDQ